MLTELTEKIIILTLQEKFTLLKEELNNLTYQELTVLYAMCLSLSKLVRAAPNFSKGPAQT
jgi:hypothetical protein